MDNKFEISEIAQGVTLCSYKTSRFKTGRISFNIVLPLDENASANAILPYILNRSSKNYPDYITLNKKLADLYGATLTPSVTKAGENHLIRLSMTMIDNKFALEKEDIILQCLNLLCDIIFNPNAEDGKFSAFETEREKRLLLERIESEKNDKRVYALRRTEEIMCKDEAFRINAYGSAEGVNVLTPETIYKAWERVLSTGLIQINAVGNVDADKIVKIVKEYISNIDRHDITKPYSKVIEKADNVNRVDEEMTVNQGKLVMGFRTGMTSEDDDYPKFRVMADIFGGGTYSRLFMNVREKMSLCYYCSARLYKQKGIMMVQSGIENENAETAINEIENQLKSMAQGAVTEEDLNASHLSMKDVFNSVCDTPEDIDAWACAQVTADKFMTPDETAAELLAVTADDVIEAAKKVTLDTIFMLSAKTDSDKEEK